MRRVRRWSEWRTGTPVVRGVVAALVITLALTQGALAQSTTTQRPSVVHLDAQARNADAQREARGPIKSPAASSYNEAPQQLLVQAEVDLQEGRTAQAYQLLEDVIARFPDSKQAVRAKDLLLEQFRSLRRGGDDKDAQERPAAADQAGGAERASAARGSAHVLRGTGDFKTAIGDRVFFDAASTTLDARQMALLRAQARWLVAHPDAQVRIEARADDPGSEQTNADLARDRGDLVRATLARSGVAKERISVVAIGNGQPIAKCAASDRAASASPCAAQNRMAVTVVEWGVEHLPARRLVTGAIDPSGRREGASPGALAPADGSGAAGRAAATR